MIKHIFTLIWSQRKKYLIVLIGHVLVFAVLMVCMIALFEAIAKYRAPGLLDSKNAITIGYMVHNGFTQQNLAQIGSTMDNIIERLRKRPYVKAISESIQFLPYMRPTEYYWTDSLMLSSGNKVYAHIKATDEAAEKVFRPQLVQGRWFQDGERPNGKFPAVVTAKFVHDARLDAPVGKTINMGPLPYEIVGVISDLKESVFEESAATVVMPIASWNRIVFYREYAAKIQPGYEDEFFSDYFNEFAHMGALAQYVEPMLMDMSKRQLETMVSTISEVLFTTIPTLFLLIFAFFGTLGLNLLDVKSRTREFALRIALGATRQNTIALIILQNILMSVMATIPGIALVLGAYGLKPIVLIAIVTTLVIVFLFAILSALYPALSIYKMNPATALKYE